MKKIYILILIIIVPFLNCKNEKNMLSVKTEVYYNVFDRSVSESINLCRAMIRVPLNKISYKENLDSILIKFKREGEFLIFNDIDDSISVSADDIYNIEGKIIGISEATNEAFISFNFMPLKVTDYEYEKIKYEKEFTKFISVHFKIKSNNILEYDHFDIVDKKEKKPLMFK